MLRTVAVMHCASSECAVSKTYQPAYPIRRTARTARSPVYGAGFLQQFVAILEMALAKALFANHLVPSNRLSWVLGFGVIGIVVRPHGRPIHKIHKATVVPQAAVTSRAQSSPRQTRRQGTPFASTDTTGPYEDSSSIRGHLSPNVAARITRAPRASATSIALRR